MGWSWSKIYVANLVSETLKLTVSQEWTYEINWFLLAGTNSRKYEWTDFLHADTDS